MKVQDAKLQVIHDLAEELLAIVLLEYHNKNHLYFGTDPKKLNEEKRRIIEEIVRTSAES